MADVGPLTKLAPTTKEVANTSSILALCGSTFPLSWSPDVKKLHEHLVSRVLPAFKDTNKKHRIYAIKKIRVSPNR